MANLNTNTNVNIDGPWSPGKGTFEAAGTFDGATVKLQFQTDDGRGWNDVGSLATFTEDGATNFELPKCNLRVQASSAGANTNVDAYVTRIGHP